MLVCAICLTTYPRLSLLDRHRHASAVSLSSQGSADATGDDHSCCARDDRISGLLGTARTSGTCWWGWPSRPSWPGRPSGSSIRFDGALLFAIFSVGGVRELHQPDNRHFNRRIASTIINELAAAKIAANKRPTGAC